MDRRSFLSTCTISAAVALIPRRLSACVTCHDFNGDGYSRSQIDCGNQTNCGPAGGARPRAFLEQLHPGIFLRRNDRTLEISEMLQYIPASIDGSLRIGDRVRRINGISVEDLQPQFTWTVGRQNGCQVELDRGTTTTTVRLELFTVRSLFDQAWLSSSTGRTLTTNFAEPIRSEIGGIEGSYATGLKLGYTGESYLVSDVLIGSPAHVSGLNIGDKVSEAQEIGDSSRTKNGVESLLPKPYPSAIRLKLERDDTAREVNMKSVGLSLLLHSIAKSTIPVRSVGTFAL